MTRGPGAREAPPASFRPGQRLLGFVLVITLVLAGFGAFLVLRNEDQQHEQTVASTVGFSEAAARSADQAVRDDLDLLDLIARSPVLTEVDPAAVQQVLNAIDTKSSGFTGGVTWVDAKGMLLAKTGRTDMRPQDLSDRPFVKAVLGGQRSYVDSGFVEKGVPGPSVILAVPALDRRGRTVGVVSGSLSLDRVARHLSGFRFGGGDVIVLDHDDRVLVAGDEHAGLTDVADDETVRMMRSGARGLVGVTDPLGHPHRLVSATVSPTADWLVMVSRSNQAAFGADRRNLEFELAGLALAVVCALVIAWNGAKRLDALQESATAAASAEVATRGRATRLRLAMADLSSGLSRQEVADIAVADGRIALGVEAASVVLCEDDNAAVLCLAAQHGFGPEHDEAWSTDDVEATAPITTAAGSGKAIFLDSESIDSVFPAARDVLASTGCRSWATVPMRAEGHIVGALTMGFADGSGMVPERQLEIAAYGTEVASSMASVRTHEVEHEFALTLQRGLLPTDLPSTGGLVVQAEYLPANAVFDVGGDWYDVLERPDGATMLVVGDVVGHGVSATAAMGQLSSVCRAVADGATPAELLGYLDRLSRRVNSAVGTTAACVLVAPDRRSATYSIAGHPRPMLVHSGTVTELTEAVSIPLGYGDVTRVEASVDLALPATLVLFTDGLIERRGIDYTERIAMLREIVASTPPAAMRDAIVEQMVTAQDPSSDDTVVVVVHLPGEPG